MLAAIHLEAHGGDVEKSLAAVSTGKSTRESLARIGDPDIDATLGHVGSATARDDRAISTAPAPTPSARPPATASGSASFGRTPRAAWGPSSWPSTPSCNREVALKQILDHHADDPASRQRFLIEAEITGGLEHPGIVPVYGLGTYDDGRPYYAMRFIKGDSLKEAIEQFHADAVAEGRPGPAVAGAAQAPAAVHGRLQRDRLRTQPRRAAPGHQAGEHHRRQARRDAGGRLGAGQATGPARAGQRPGERTLMPVSASGSRRDAAGQRAGHAGVHEPRAGLRRPRPAGPAVGRLQPGRDALLPADRAGRRSRATTSATCSARCSGASSRRPRQLDPSIDQALEAVCLKAMATQPEDRYASCRALADDVERWMADEPVTAWRRAVGRRARRWAKRNRTAVTVAAVALLAGVVGLSAVLAVQTRAKGAIAGIG